MSTPCFTVAKSFACFATDGKCKETNSYYGASQILRPTYQPIQVAVGTRIHDMPGGRWLEVAGKLMSFSLDNRNPNDVGCFEKHHDPTPYCWKRLITDGSVVPGAPVGEEVFIPMYTALRALQKGA